MDKQRYDIMIGMQAGELAKGVQSAKGNLKDLRQAFKDTLDVLNTAPPAQIGVTKQLEDARKKVAQLAAEIKKLEDSGKKRIQDVTPKQRATVGAGAIESQSLIRAAQPSVIEAARDKQRAAAFSELQNKSITLRYALYDVAASVNQASQALLGYASASVMAAAAQERAFSQIQKTMIGEVSTEQLEKLRQELIALSTTIPVSFTELTKIGMLGSQLGIEAENVAKFTEVVAKFSAITGMSVEESAMGFGKLQNLLGLNGDQFEALGAAIAKVGVESAATEQQIISTGGQIAAVARAAGFSASEIVGLSASFASLKIAPEEARGVVVRTFNEINTAVGTFSEAAGRGGERLKRFAQIAGISSEEFASGWGSGPEGASGVFEKFIRGLSTREIQGELRQLGLDGVRTSKGLTALAKDVDAIFGANGTIAIARQAGMAGTFLDESFATIAEDLASKLDMLKNSFENLLAAGAGEASFMATLGAIVDAITRFNEVLTKAMNNSEVVSGIVQLTILIAALLGGVLALSATLALSAAGFAAMRTAFVATKAMGIDFGTTLMWLKGQLATLRGATAAASGGFVGMGAGASGATAGILTLAGAMRVLKLAIASTGIGLAVIAVGEIAAAFMQSSSPAEEAARGLDELNKKYEELQTEAQKAKEELQAFITQALEPIADFTKAQDALFNLGKSIGDNQNKWSEYSQSGRQNINALQSTINAYVQAFGGDSQELANQLEALKQYMISMGLGGAFAFEMIDMAIAETGMTAQEVLANMKSFDSGINAIGDSAGRTQTALEKMTAAFDKAFAKLDSSIKLETTIDNLGKSLDENGKKFNVFTDAGRKNFSALRDLVFSLKDRLADNPQSLANALASLRVSMVKLGITSKLAFKTVDTALGATGVKGKATKKIVDGLTGSIAQAMEDAKGLTTVTDYAEDLGSVLNDALNNRYAKQDARDSITGAWQSIAESADDARKAIDDANASLNEMQADRGILEYQLQVAIRYGDTLRAESIKAKLAKLDADLVQKRNDLADAQAEANKTLVGNTKYAIANRAVVRDLVEDYNNYLVSLAQSGMSSEQLNTEAAKLADEFLAQGVELGFAKEELLKYTDAFKKDFTTVVNNVPKDITLNVVTDPALQAVVDFVKGTNAELAKILSGTVNVNVPGITTGGLGLGAGAGSGGGVGGGTSSRTGTGTTPQPTETNTSAKAAELVTQRQAQLDNARAALDKQNALIEATKKEADAIRVRIKLAGKPTPELQPKLKRLDEVLAIQQRNARPLQQTVSAALQALQAAQAALPRLTGTPNTLSQVPSRFRNGGLVRGAGSGTSDSIPALVSNGEYVLRANAVKYYGADFMNSLNQMQVQRGGTATGSNVVYLSPDDRALLRAAIDRPISLYTDNTRIAESANAGNVVLAQRGMK